MKIKTTPYVAEKIQRTKKDFRVDYFRGSGAGGQNRNKRDTAVRITDLITGLSVSCEEERKREQNKTRAFRRLVDKLVKHYTREEMDLIIQGEHETQAWIRTYKEKGNMVIDKRTGKKVFNMDEILSGYLDELIEEIRLNEI